MTNNHQAQWGSVTQEGLVAIALGKHGHMHFDIGIFSKELVLPSGLGTEKTTTAVIEHKGLEEGNQSSA